MNIPRRPAVGELVRVHLTASPSDRRLARVAEVAGDRVWVGCDCYAPRGRSGRLVRTVGGGYLAPADAADAAAWADMTRRETLARIHWLGIRGSGMPSREQVEVVYAAAVACGLVVEEVQR